MKQEIYKLFKDGKTSCDIYNTFVKEYEEAKNQFHTEQAKQEKEKIEAEKRAAAQRTNNTSASSPKEATIARLRTELADAFYDYCDFLMPEPIDYETWVDSIEESLKDFEKAFCDGGNTILSFINAVKELADSDENTDAWKAVFNSSFDIDFTIDDDTISNDKQKFSNHDDKRDSVNKINQHDSDNKVIKDFLKHLIS